MQFAVRWVWGPSLLTVLRFLNSMNSWASWTRHIPSLTAHLLQYFHIYRYVDKCVPHSHAPLARRQYTMQGTYARDTAGTPHAQNDHPTIISQLETHPARRLVPNIPTIQGFGIPDGHWVVVGWWLLFFPKRSLQERVQGFFFKKKTQGYIKKQRLYGKGHNYSIARKDPELLVI